MLDKIIQHELFNCQKFFCSGFIFVTEKNLINSYNKNLYTPNFQSSIRLLHYDDYVKALSNIDKKNFVPSPWTVKESVLAENASTNCVIDCTVCGLTDGQKVLMLHICPTKDEFIKSKIDLTNKNIQGFLLGSKPKFFYYDARSSELFENFKNFMKENKIPFSYFQGGDHVNPHDVAYCSGTDEWLISNDFIEDISKQTTPTKFIQQTKMFDKFEISALDELSW